MVDLRKTQMLKVDQQSRGNIVFQSIFLMYPFTYSCCNNMNILKMSIIGEGVSGLAGQVCGCAQV